MHLINPYLYIQVFEIFRNFDANLYYYLSTVGIWKKEIRKFDAETKESNKQWNRRIRIGLNSLNQYDSSFHGAVLGHAGYKIGRDINNEVDYDEEKYNHRTYNKNYNSEKMYKPKKKCQERSPLGDLRRCKKYFYSRCKLTKEERGALEFLADIRRFF